MGEPRRIAIAGATGYIGGLLARELAGAGESVRALVRTPAKAGELEELGCEVVKADVLDRPSIDSALVNIEVAYYLVHSMGRGSDADFAERDHTGAENFAAAASEAGVKQIIYMGGLGEGSEHLSSRQETAEVLMKGDVPVTYFRAAAVIGAGSESFLTVYYLVKRLPLMVTPKWTQNRTQPIAIADVIAYLVEASVIEKAKGAEVEIAGPTVTTYGGMMDAIARAMDRRPPIRVKVPLLTPGLSSRWIGLVTPVDTGVARPLIEGLAHETIVKDPSGMKIFHVPATPMDVAMSQALAEMEKA